ncbi:hypothetical protein [Psychrobacter sp. LV10R520-6]|uniref:hypothetical protein n=1 Tax=Psychrobacter sp. LV10R520-6 TaxID=1415574 RepID=UPI002AA0B18F|nr:hypothetical protein [Psychrobacter sp. LV10R520-6]
MNNQPTTPPQKIESNKPWVILGNGKKHYMRATTFDIVVSIFLPILRLILGLVALIKKEYKRGGTMIVIGFIVSIVFTLLSVL